MGLRYLSANSSLRTGVRARRRPIRVALDLHQPRAPPRCLQCAQPHASQRIPEAIAAAAQQHGCDVIVMATHDGGPLRELFLGSYTKRLMARTKIPPLVPH